MTKTPEEMAEEWMTEEYGDTSHWVRMGKDMSIDAFLAGYQAAKDEYKEAIDTYNDVAKQMLEEAVRIMSPQDQLADADKVIAEDTCEHILYMEKMVDVNPSSGWISVKDRLPEEGEIVMTSCEQGKMFLLRKVSEEFLGATLLWKYCCGYDKDLADGESYCYEITHWMPLPEAPEEA